MDGCWVGREFQGGLFGPLWQYLAVCTEGEARRKQDEEYQEVFRRNDFAIIVAMISRVGRSIVLERGGKPGRVSLKESEMY